MRIEPRSALPKLCMWTPSTNEVTKTRILALRTRRKRPSVSIVIGSVRTMRIGRTKVLRIMRNNATTTAGIHPVTSIPGTTYDTTRNEPAVIMSLMKKCITKCTTSYEYASPVPQRVRMKSRTPTKGGRSAFLITYTSRLLFFHHMPLTACNKSFSFLVLHGLRVSAIRDRHQFVSPHFFLMANRCLWLLCDFL